MSPKQQVLWWEFHENETVTLDRATELVGGDIYCNQRFYVGQILKRMIDNGWIERVGRGVYKKAAESAKKTGPAVGGIKCAGTSSAVMPSMREWALKHGIINETASPNPAPPPLNERHNAGTTMSAKKAGKTGRKKPLIVVAPAVACSRFFIAEPGDWLVPHPDIAWTKWEVGDHRGQDRICLTSCKRKAELIRDALEAFHENH